MSVDQAATIARPVLTMGTWSVPHLGHAAFLRRCAEFGDLVVGVNSDAFVTRYRGEPALFNENERLTLIEALGYRAVINDGPGADLIRTIRPWLLVVGTDWARRDYHAQIGMDQDEMDVLGVGLLFLPVRPLGISSSEIRRRLAAA